MQIMPYFKMSLLVTSLFSVVPAPAFADIQAIGWIEHVKVSTANLVFNAKIDTGADNSSINASNIEIYQHSNGSKHVKFSVENRDGVRSDFNLPLVRITHIKRKGAEPLNRPVVSMNLCIGNTLKTVEVNLANRNNFKYHMLVGRTYLKDAYLVDVNKKYTTEPNCVPDPLAANKNF